MKRNIMYSFVSIMLATGSFSCWLIAQEPATTTYSTSNGTSGFTFRTDSSGRTDSSVATATAAASASNSDVEEEKLHRDIQQLLEKYKSVDSDSEKKTIMTQVGDLVAKQFELRQEAKQQELQKLEEQLLKLKEIHNKRAKQKDRIVSDRVQQLFFEADGLGWGSSDGNRSWATNPFGQARPSVFNSSLGRPGTASGQSPFGTGSTQPSTAVPRTETVPATASSPRN